MNQTPIFTPKGHAAYLTKARDLSASNAQMRAGLEEANAARPDDREVLLQGLTQTLGVRDARLEPILSALEAGEVHEPIEQSERVAIGSMVVLSSDEGLQTITVGGFGESNPRQGLLSYTSPFAGALLGATVGDTVVVDLPGERQLEVTIEDILPPSRGYNNLFTTAEGSLRSPESEGVNV